MSDQITRLQDIIVTLRGPNGCPWDQAQTFETMTQYIREESEELISAIESQNIESIKNELGDVLLHVIMLSQMAEEKKWFQLNDVAESSINKMIRRHPHVFGDTKVNSIEDVLKNWEKIKQAEKNSKNIST